jgi:acyl-CoA synthetase (AMP-forming)/AMP-acid ligase II
MNIAELFFQQVEIQPRATAVVSAKRLKHKKYLYHKISFAQLGKRAQFYAGQFHAHGMRAGDKVLMFLPPGHEFPAVTFALFWIGAVPVFIDPGMGKKGLLQCARHVRPDYLIGSTLAMALCAFEIDSFSTIKKFFSISKSVLACDLSSPHSQWALPPCHQADNKALAAILFTSGATGPAKGVEYTHSIFIHQTHWLKNLFNLQAPDIDYPGFPLFSLFTLAMGMTTCPPDLDAKAPGRCDPARLVQQIIDTKATFLAGSPAIWKRVADYCIKRQIQLPHVKQLVMFGAPVAAQLHRDFRFILPHGDTYTPYGATEALPISCISGREILGDDKNSLDHNPLNNLASLNAQGSGTCVGAIVADVNCMIVAAKNSPMIADDLQPLNAGEVGEILVNGPVVTARYYQLADATKSAKVVDHEGKLWHRMGDVGYIDDEGRLWFCGRQSHIAQGARQVLYSDPIEGIFNAHPDVLASALVPSLPNKKAVLVVLPGKYPNLASERRQLGQRLSTFCNNSTLTSQIQALYVARKLPVDNRHNIKIDRLELAKMIARGELHRIDQ